MDSIGSGTISSAHRGRTWRAAFLKFGRYVTTRLEVETSPGHWIFLVNFPATSWASDAELRASIGRRIDEHFEPH